MNLSLFEKCLIPTEERHPDFFSWFLNQEHIPFDISSDGWYWNEKEEALKNIWELYKETGSTYYWFVKTSDTNRWVIVSDEGSEIVSTNSVKLDIVKLRDFKLSELLS